MNSLVHTKIKLTGCLLSRLALVLGLSLAIRSEAGEIVAAAKTPGTTPAAKPAPADVSPPKSIFVMPRGPEEGKDPFFPASRRPYERMLQIPSPSTNPAPVAVDLRLNGISGTSDRRLAIINYQTFAVGEDGSVPTPLGKVMIRCLEIRADSVIVQVAGDRRELRLAR